MTTLVESKQRILIEGQRGIEPLNRNPEGQKPSRATSTYRARLESEGSLIYKADLVPFWMPRLFAELVKSFNFPTEHERQAESPKVILDSWPRVGLHVTSDYSRGDRVRVVATCLSLETWARFHAAKRRAFPPRPLASTELAIRKGVPE